MRSAGRSSDMLLLLACVIDNGVQGKVGQATPFDTNSEYKPFDTEDSTASTSEICNGKDDDGDGAIDEDFEDFDGDGIADCVDSACDLATTPAGAVTTTASCDVSVWNPTGDVSDYVVEWSMRGPYFLSSPVVANLTDDNGDGTIDIADIPDILAVDYSTGTLYALSGDGAGEHWRRSLGVDPMGVAAADVDGDGLVNIVVRGAKGLCALEPDGTELWCNAGAAYSYNGGPTVTDLDGDGRAEVIASGVVADGVTGATLATGVCASGATFPVVGDLDGDGLKEIVCGAEVFRADGTLAWSHGVGAYNYGALVDVDLDDVPEVLVTGWGAGIKLYSWDGMELASLNSAGMYSAACVADLDGDGLPNIAVPSQTQLEVYDADLKLQWSLPTVDMSGAASCSAFDFDADGAYELVYADEHTLSVLDGASGVPLFQWGDHASGTMWEYPTIVDVDNDGSSEIVVFESFYGNDGLVVIGSSTNSWPPTGPNWAQYAFDGGNVSDAGAVLPDPPPPWRDGGFVHARPPGFLDSASGTWSTTRGAPDLGIDVTDLCVADCEDGPVSVSLSATNRSDQDTDAVVVLYADEETGLREVASATITLRSASRSDPLVFDLRPGDLGTYGVRATIARADGGSDCDPADNEARWTDVSCPD